VRYLLLFLLSSAYLFGQTTERQTFTTASGTTLEATAGQIMVPENRDRPSSTPIPVAYLRLHGGGDEPPVFFLEGGPGSTANWRANDPDELERWIPLLQVRDVILIDQRGTGPSAQRLTYLTPDTIPHDVLLNVENATAHYRKMLPKALTAWNAAGVDYAGYHTRAAADDLEDLRRHLGLEQVVLYGFSYGTLLGQAYLKYYGDRVARAIFVGVEGLAETFKEPLRMDAQLHHIAALVAADDTLSQSIPDLVALYDRVAARLDREPLDVTLTNPLTGADMRLLVGKFGLDLLLRFDLGDASDIPDVPAILYELDHGGSEGLESYLARRYTSLFGLNAMPLATDLASGASEQRIARIRREVPHSRFADVMNFPFLQLRDAWPVAQLDDAFRRPFTSRIPTLLLSGSLDMNTPPAQAESLAWWLPNATHIVVKNAGHEQIMTHPGVATAVRRFLDGQPLTERYLAWHTIDFRPAH
jgi:pimeloyl-ACP methyl ester carboxylesterase